jgi:hypothetical protein
MFATLATSTMLSCNDFAEDGDCADICKKLRDCSPVYIGVQTCTDQCFDTTHDNHTLRDMASECSDCVDDYSCHDVPRKCVVCDDFLVSFTSYSFESAVDN